MTTRAEARLHWFALAEGESVSDETMQWLRQVARDMVAAEVADEGHDKRREAIYRASGLAGDVLGPERDADRAMVLVALQDYRRKREASPRRFEHVTASEHVARCLEWRTVEPKSVEKQIRRLLEPVLDEGEAAWLAATLAMGKTKRVRKMS